MPASRRSGRHAPNPQVVFLVVIRRDENILFASLAIDICTRHQIRRLDESAWRHLVERAIEFINCLICLKFDGLRDGR
jgi:hypothetical protein